MAPAQLSEAEVTEILKSTKVVESELNKNDKVSAMLIIKKWTVKSVVDAVAASTLESKDALITAVRTAIALSEFDFHLVERAVLQVGSETCTSVLRDVVELVTKVASSVDALEANRDAVFTAEGVRRTPGGIYWRLLKERIPKDDSKVIFKGNTKRQQGMRRQLVRERWTENHLTVLGNKKARTAESADQIRAIKAIASTLSMSEVSIIERLIVKKGIDYAHSVVAEVSTILSGPVDSAIASTITVVGEEGEVKRRRTPGGVFAHLVKGKADITDSEKRFIFARATGGRAPSMSDLMSMSLALRDRMTYPVRTAPPPAPPTASVEAEWEYQRKVGDTWEPGFIGQDNYGDAMTDCCSDENDPIDEIFSRIAKGLKLYSEGIDFIEKVNAAVGIKLVVQAYRETVETERAGGLMISESNQRRRTPKGVFLAVLRRLVGNETVNRIIGVSETDEAKLPSVLAPQLLLLSSGDAVASKSKLADQIIIELERMRIPESDFEVIRNVVAIKGEAFVRNLFEKVRKRFNKGKWLDTPGQLFGKMLKTGLTNDELNTAVEHSRTKQLVRNNKLSVSRSSTVLLSPAEEKCVRELTLGLALIGVTANEVSTIERVVARLGEERAVRMLKRTREIELEGGQRTRDGLRRKTPSGVYLSLLGSEEKVDKEDSKFIFDKQASSAEERKKEDTHFAPSLFTPVNPLRVIDNSGKDAEFIEKIKKQIRPALFALECISVLDPRLETVIRGVVLLGPSAIHLIDQCVYTFGEKRTEGWLEISHAQVADSKASVDQLPAIYNDLVKAAGGLSTAPVETTAGVRC